MGSLRNISLAWMQRALISSSNRLAVFPGRHPLNSSNFSMTASTSKLPSAMMTVGSQHVLSTFQIKECNEDQVITV
eukprot:m.5602 g.5602  ORF g.5602 m.5602 type:complete len:76 (-) comp3337_c0_seq1:53-280(-)